ncbi:hypothetical protein GCK72_009551 [Caenorhabditis remanei]|nr:hypothetical protein GCK72_009551 [Caenorhabditis remanei]KAF1761295.1 hypothetical protein GCK72_009551 [Caenorhabditis remanei]
MGHTFSSSSSSKKTIDSTPQRSTNPSTCLDPRSPSQDIERTPIQVNNVSDTKINDSTKKDEKPRHQSLRQRMFEKKKNNNEVPTDQ